MRTSASIAPECAVLLNKRIVEAIAICGYCVLDEFATLGFDQDPDHREEQLREFAATHGWSIAIRNRGQAALFLPRAQPWLSRL